MVSTTGQLPNLDSDFSVSPSKTETYLRDGHCVIRNLASQEEVDAYLPVIAEALDQNKRDFGKLEDRDTYHKAFIQVGNLWEIDERVKKFVLAKRFAQVAAKLMGVDGVRVYHDQALFKEPHGGHTPWHQDQVYWPIDTEKTITMWMPLVDCPVEMGSLIFATGVHKRGAASQLAISDKSREFFTQKAREDEWPLQMYELTAGDATFHSGWTPHKAPGNDTDQMRPVMTVIYMAHDAKVAEPTNDFQPIDMERWFPGCKPGDHAATELNPLVYMNGSK